jgi:lysophospholipase L1-like esterase
MSIRLSVRVSIALVLAAVSFAAVDEAAVRAATPQVSPRDDARPTLFIIGDSTVRNTANGGLGWGAPIEKLFDTSKIKVTNSAIAGRSARSFFSEGRWDGPQGVKTRMKAGDFVLMQFGTNDGPGNEQQIATLTNGRPDLKGIGEETTTGPDSSAQHKIETVHTYGWYMDLFCRDTLAKGGTPIMLTMVPQLNRENKPTRRTETFVLWSKQVAEKENISFINLNDISATRLEKEEDPFTKYFSPPGDRTHTNPAGAQFNAESVVMGIRAIPSLKLNEYLSEEGKKLAPADASDVEAPKAK